MPIALFSDLLSLLTIHIYSFYVASARIYHWQATIIVSLFHLFRGKKHNVLRNRIDSCDYDLDQLLLGTILFTLLFFLLPTVAVFYFTFASARIGIISLKAALDTLLACLNHFPLFALMLRVKDSRRLPGISGFSWISRRIANLPAGGICFELKDTPNVALPSMSPQNAPPTSYIHLKVSQLSSTLLTTIIAISHTLQSVPLSLRNMFDQYFQLGSGIRKHYLSLSVIFYLATGQFVPPIHRRNLYSLQYSMLPAKRAEIIEVWTRLTDSPPASNGVTKNPNGIHVRRVNR